MMKKQFKSNIFCILALILAGNVFCAADAALTVDRSRFIYDEGSKSISVNVTNLNNRDPYLAQGWLEDESENKLTGPLMVLPPVQRVEPGTKTQVRIQALPELGSLPQDRESVFWFNLREIPPKTEKVNTLMLAMQMRLKVFYRPKAIKVDPMLETVPGTETLTLIKKNGRFVVDNPTPYYFTFVDIRTSAQGEGIKDFESVMVAPKSQQSLAIVPNSIGDSPALIFVNDFGTQKVLPFRCTEAMCKAGKVEKLQKNRP